MHKPYLTHVYLTGFMGAGKSAAGAALAEMLGRPCLDMDQELSRHFAMPVAEIFAQLGEAAFRQAENQLLRKIAAQARPCIVSAGGGVVMDEANRALMDKSGLRIFLDIAPQQCRERLGSEEVRARPLWQDPEQVLRLWQQRYPFYQSAALRVDARPPLETVVEAMGKKLLPALPALIDVGEGRCELELAWLKDGKDIKASLGQHKNLLLLDQALRADAGLWQNSGFRVQVMRRRSESLKTLQQVKEILGILEEDGLARDDFLLTRGGGCLSDAGGFCAAIYKRGLNFIVIATTLLAAVDAAVGGKTAINFGRRKNQIGVFYLPRRVILDMASWRSLRPPQLADGLIEAYKTGLIADPELADFVEKHLDIMRQGDIPALAWLAGRSMQLKAALVQQDFREQKGIRAYLNLGHSFAHALESYSAYKVSHGRAVAAGLMAALKVSHKKLALPPADCERIAATIGRICRLPPLPPYAETRQALAHDKKIRSGVLGFIGLRKPGQAQQINDLSIDEIISAAYER